MWGCSQAPQHTRVSFLAFVCINKMRLYVGVLPSTTAHMWKSLDNFGCQSSAPSLFGTVSCSPLPVPGWLTLEPQGSPVSSSTWCRSAGHRQAGFLSILRVQTQVLTPVWQALPHKPLLIPEMSPRPPALLPFLRGGR